MRIFHTGQFPGGKDENLLKVKKYGLEFFVGAALLLVDATLDT